MNGPDRPEVLQGTWPKEGESRLQLVARCCREWRK